MKRLHLILSTLLVLGSTAWPASAQDKYPSKPIKVILPYGAGSATDIITRIMCDQLRQVIGQPCVVPSGPGLRSLVWPSRPY